MIDTALLTTVIWITLIGIGLAFAIGIAIVADQALRHRESRTGGAAPAESGAPTGARTLAADAATTADVAATDQAASEKQPA
ncbi:hypothetical protein NOGI109294_02645 [Nocardiopsis gilva]|nr:hypothetical protein [Nocardiopsis gilva]